MNMMIPATRENAMTYLEMRHTHSMSDDGATEKCGAEACGQHSHEAERIGVGMTPRSKAYDDAGEPGQDCCQFSKLDE